MTSLRCGPIIGMLASLGLLAAVASRAAAEGGGSGDYIDASPTLSISDVSRSEGNSGNKDFEFRVRLSSTSSQTVTVNYKTVDGSATTADNDYVPITGTLTFPPGRTSRDIEVKVVGNYTNEPDEQFFVELYGAVNATIADPSGTGTIRNDDPLNAKLAIDDVSKYEGNSGTTSFTFTISLSNRRDTPVTVQYFTSDGSAKVSNNDYMPASGTLTIPAGGSRAKLTIRVRGDRRIESDETFFVNLFNAVGAIISDNKGRGTIRNDDGRDDDSAEHIEEPVAFARPTVFPNPTHNEGTLAFATIRSGPVRVELLDVAGRVVATLADESDMPAGVHQFAIGGDAGERARLSPGIYFYRVRLPDRVTTGRFVVLE